jgi:hypothetical protein
MQYPVSEILDRLSIVSLKVERIGEPHLLKEKEDLLSALSEYGRTVKIEQAWLSELYEINGQIWDLESDIRAGKEKLLELDEVGRRAIAIRDLNKVRVGIKNKITEATKTGYIDVKVNHGSE